MSVKLGLAGAGAVGGGGGSVTLTVAVAVLVPPGPVAVRVYVVEAPGNTRRLALACTVPMLLSMEMLLASVTFQLSVDDWPRSIEDGSAANAVTVGAADGGAGAGAGAGAGGGGGGGGAFFLHPAANIANIRQMPMVLIFRLFNMN
jgi:hypothetical protein